MRQGSLPGNTAQGAAFYKVLKGQISAEANKNLFLLTWGLILKDGCKYSFNAVRKLITYQHFPNMQQNQTSTEETPCCANAQGTG